MKILLIILLMLPVNLIAVEHNKKFIEDPYLAKCHVTNLPQINDAVPSHFSLTNNLTKNWLSANELDDHNYVIEGKLLDEKCVPIRDATIYAWQPNFPSKDRSNSSIESGLGNAVSNTNNLGQFSFFSSTKNVKLDKLNLLITHPDFPIYKTKISLFDNNPHLKIHKEGNKFSFVITLKNSNKHQKF